MEKEILDASALTPKITPEAITRSIASKGRRFANMLIDTIAIYVMIFAGVFLTGVVFPDFIDGLVNAMDHPVWSRLFGAFLFFLFYVVMEWGTKGKTIGKFVTNTRVVKDDGTPLTLATIARRSASRLVPFEAFSFLGSNERGWHDRWSDTAVVYVPALESLRSPEMNEEMVSQRGDSIVN